MLLKARDQVFDSFIGIIIIIVVHEIFPVLYLTEHMVGFYYLLPCGWVVP